MKTGDTIMFRGRRRFVVANRRSLVLERVIGDKPVAYYSVSQIEKATLRVVLEATPADVERARKLLESTCPAWTRIEWDSAGQPHYIHNEKKFPR